MKTVTLVLCTTLLIMAAHADDAALRRAEQTARENTQYINDKIALLQEAMTALQKMPESPEKQKLILGLEAGLDLANRLNQRFLADGAIVLRDNRPGYVAPPKRDPGAIFTPPYKKDFSPSPASAPASASARPETATTPAEIDAAIKRNAERDYPGNDAAQQTAIAAEKKAWSEITALKANGVTGVPKGVLDDIIASALRSYESYAAGSAVIHSEIRRYKELHPAGK